MAGNKNGVKAPPKHEPYHCAGTAKSGNWNGGSSKGKSGERWTGFEQGRGEAAKRGMGKR